MLNNCVACATLNGCLGTDLFVLQCRLDLINMVLSHSMLSRDGKHMLDCVISHLGVTCEKRGPYPGIKQAGLSGHAWLA